MKGLSRSPRAGGESWQGGQVPTLIVKLTTGSEGPTQGQPPPHHRT